MSFIWFPDEISAFNNVIIRSSFGGYERETPAIMISFVGWLFLVVVYPLIAYLLWR